MLASAVACSARDGAEPARDVRGRSAAPLREASHAPAVSPAPARPSGAAAPDTLLATAEVYAGWRDFNVNCQSCHGFDAVASDVAPDLRHSVGDGGTVTLAQFREVVKKGRMAKGMPAWGALLDARQIDQIYAYLRARSSGALGAGKPSVGGD